jgi:small subunit ribosomal protein S16
LRGVAKGALSEAEAEAKFQKWLAEKEAKIEAKRKGLEEKSRNAKKEMLDAETKIKEAREAELAKKRAAEMEAAAPKVEEAPAEETTSAEETPAADEPKAETEEK